MADANALALHNIDAVGKDGEQQVCNAIIEQVDLVDVEDTAVSFGQEACRRGTDGRVRQVR